MAVGLQFQKKKQEPAQIVAPMRRHLIDAGGETENVRAEWISIEDQETS